jgi:DNA (cytosine-5)-methyltransferase 1
MAGYCYEIEIVSARECGGGHRRERLFIISYADREFRQLPASWSEQVREMVQRERVDSQWLTVRDIGSSRYSRLSVQLVRGSESVQLDRSEYTEPTNTPGRIRARKLAGRTVTPAQASIVLQRVLYLHGLQTGGD